MGSRWNSLGLMGGLGLPEDGVPNAGSLKVFDCLKRSLRTKGQLLAKGGEVLQKERMSMPSLELPNTTLQIRHWHPIAGFRVIDKSTMKRCAQIAQENGKLQATMRQLEGEHRSRPGSWSRCGADADPISWIGPSKLAVKNIDGRWWKEYIEEASYFETIRNMERNIYEHLGNQTQIVKAVSRTDQVITDQVEHDATRWGAEGRISGRKLAPLD